ncbi:hypothetical protein ACFSE1_00440 [Rhizobium helianthi]|uniref:Uncharacterized protein n=1 Tax=Rhizobium helianthi TaxID=1132695 RepID=A0ABW4LZG3_9HYPH
MKKLIVASLAIVLGASTISFAAELGYATEGRLSINMVGSTISQKVDQDGQIYAETFVVQPDHTLKLVNRAALQP